MSFSSNFFPRGFYPNDLESLRDPGLPVNEVEGVEDLTAPDMKSLHNSQTSSAFDEACAGPSHSNAPNLLFHYKALAVSSS